MQDWFSTNSPVVKASEAGPNGRNNARPADAAAQLPASTLARPSRGLPTAGSKWAWGRRVGEGFMRGSYPGSRTDRRWRAPALVWLAAETHGTRSRSNQPYYAYKASGRYTLAPPTPPGPCASRRPAAMPRRVERRHGYGAQPAHPGGGPHRVPGQGHRGWAAQPAGAGEARGLLLDHKQRNGFQGGRGRLHRKVLRRGEPGRPVPLPHRGLWIRPSRALRFAPPLLQATSPSLASVCRSLRCPAS